MKTEHKYANDPNWHEFLRLSLNMPEDVRGKFNTQRAEEVYEQIKHLFEKEER